MNDKEIQISLLITRIDELEKENARLCDLIKRAKPYMENQLRHFSDNIKVEQWFKDAEEKSE